MTTTQVWRVVCEGGEVKRPDVGSVGDGDYVAMTGEPDDEHVGDGTTQRAAILDLCRVAGWDATELVAPGAQTADERLAQVTAERDRMAGLHDAVLEACNGIAAAMGCRADDLDDCGEAVRLLVAERDTARAEVAALRTIVEGRTP